MLYSEVYLRRSVKTRNHFLYFTDINTLLYLFEYPDHVSDSFRSSSQVKIRRWFTILCCFFLAHLVIESDSFGTIKIHSVQDPIYYLCIGGDGKPVGVPQVSSLLFVDGVITVGKVLKRKK